MFDNDLSDQLSVVLVNNLMFHHRSTPLRDIIAFKISYNDFHASELSILHLLLQYIRFHGSAKSDKYHCNG